MLYDYDIEMASRIDKNHQSPRSCLALLTRFDRSIALDSCVGIWPIRGERSKQARDCAIRASFEYLLQIEYDSALIFEQALIISISKIG